MREIKFRAWVNGEMLTQPLNTPFGASRLFGFLDAQGVHEFNNVMQYTGLKDKNGVEIYEGDIVEGGFPGIIGTIYTCVFNDIKKSLGFIFSEINLLNCANEPICGDFIYIGKFTHAEQMKIIGNIYENPELLEKS